MSELKVNSISGIGASVRINDPVGLGTNSKSGYALNTNGKVNIEGSVEVVTIPASNFGVRIRAPYPGEAGSTDSVLQFTNNSGNTEFASLRAVSNGGLTISTGGQPRIFIDGEGLTFGPKSNFSAQAKFNILPPSCSVLPTGDDHLVNKAYVDALIRGSVDPLGIGSIVLVTSTDYNQTATKTEMVPRGWIIQHSGPLGGYNEYIKIQLPSGAGTWDGSVIMRTLEGNNRTVPFKVSGGVAVFPLVVSNQGWTVIMKRFG